MGESRESGSIALKILINLAIAAWWCLAPATSSNAATVRELSLREVYDQAAFVFEGVAIAHEIVGRGGAIRTCVRFEVRDVIKGPAHDGARLCFPGGELSGVRRVVPGTTFPRVGESGIYFARPNASGALHPLVGWDQGHYCVLPGERGQPAVHTAGRRLVVGVDEGTTPLRPRFAGGAARGIHIRVRGDSAPGLDPEAFKGALRAMGATP